MFIDILKKLFTNTSTGRRGVTGPTETAIKREWENINILLSQKGPSQLRQALISADKTLDNALRDVAPGTTMGERLKATKDRFDPYIYNKVWEAHKVRNNLVHEAGYEPPHYMLTEAVENLRKGLDNLGIRV